MERSRSFIVHYVKLVTVEPVVFIYNFGAFLQWLSVQALVYEKSCSSHYNSTTCANLTSHESEEDVVQTDASHWLLILNLVNEFPSIFVSLICGNIGDRVNRKLALALPMMGQLVASSNYILMAQRPELPMGVLLISPLMQSFSGGWIAFQAAYVSYVGSDSTKTTRTVRIAIVAGVDMASIAISSFISGKILDATSFTFIFSLALTLYLICLAYIWFILRYPREYSDNEGRPKKEKDVKEAMKSSCSPRGIWDAVCVVFKRRTMDRRKLILLVLGSNMLTNFSLAPYMHGIAYLYVKRHPLGWSQTLYGYYCGYKQVLGAVGLLVLLPLLKTRARLRETAIMLIAVITSATSEVLFGVSSKTWMVFSAGVLVLFSVNNRACVQSLLSSLVEPTELGKILAVQASLCRIDAMLVNVIYNNLYPLTLDFYAGTVFIAGAALSIVPLSMIVYLHKELGDFDSYSNLQEDAEPRTAAIDGMNSTDMGNITEKDNEENVIV